MLLWKALVKSANPSSFPFPLKAVLKSPKSSFFTGLLEGSSALEIKSFIL